MPECPNCRLTLRRLDTKFGALPRHSLYLTDRSGTLSLRAIKELRALLGLFQQKFPQSLFSVFIVGRVANGSISEYTFWLANRARFSSVEAGAGENFDLLLGIDLQARAAALLVGYGLENYLSERDLERALARASSAFHAGDVARGIRVCVEFMIDRMREVARDVEKHGPPKSDAPIMAER
jgi:uncharacterized membrane protein YgcG